MFPEEVIVISMLITNTTFYLEADKVENSTLLDKICEIPLKTLKTFIIRQILSIINAALL